MNDPDLDRLLTAAGAQGDATYVPVMVLDTLVLDARIMPHPAGCALVMSCANGIQHRYPMDALGLARFRRMVADAPPVTQQQNGAP